MNWIRKTIAFISLLIITFFAAQANESVVDKIESKKADTTFSIDYTDSLAFIQPQTGYHLVGNIKTNSSGLIKWFDSLLVAVPQHQAINTASNFANQFSTQSKKVLLMLYPFHFFW
ncbi:hypothetical protein CFS9_31360 [Flavobacterium sp. CFS9]|uniref:Uncharacterized protein n=1 Tax=Flavobacterium sp. CFS9 TaxID=3143118 RepID=A0AAT9H535_9FLAO